MDLEYASRILTSALKSAGALLMERWGRTTGARIKESIHSVVTDADLASEKRILGILDQTRERCNILTEESGYTDHGSPYTWIVDPLDGTSNFAAGLPWFGVIVALMNQSEVVLGGMYLPAEEQLYLARQGAGATRNGLAIHTTGSGDLKEQLVSYSFDHHPDPGRTLREMELMGRLSSRVRNLRSTNSLIDFCYTADGRLGAALNQTTRIWDIAAPALIIREAGGIVTDINGREISLMTGAEDGDRNYTILAAGRNLHATLAGVISSPPDHSSEQLT